jgi:hypothetical protein
VGTLRFAHPTQLAGLGRHVDITLKAKPRNQARGRIGVVDVAQA